MAYSALALARTADGWSGAEVDLLEAEDLDGVAEAMRDVAGEADGADGLVLLFVEEDDEYLALVRVDGDDDPRVFLSDSRSVQSSTIAALLADSDDVAAPPPTDDEEDDDTAASRAAATPAGDETVLADLGTPGPDLLDLAAQEGKLPGDVITVLCERAGCADVLEELREGV